MTVTIYGIHPVLEAVKKRPRAFHKILLVKHDGGEGIKQIVRLAEKSNIKIYHDTPKNICRFSRSEQHQGIVAEVDPFPLIDLKTLVHEQRRKEKKAFYLVVDSIQDPRNFGSLIRTAVCSGVQAVIFPKDRTSRLTGTVAKASAGAIEHVPLCRVVNIASALETLKLEEIWIVGASPKSRETIYEFDFDLDLALVLGSEEKGIRPLILKKCDFILSIPIQGALDSLNASAAGAVLLFEAMRQRRHGKDTPGPKN